jgi:hypothetical protein
MDARDIANTLDTNNEKGAMLQSIADLRNEVRRLSDTISQKIGIGPKNEDLRSVVEDVFKKNSNKGKSVDEIAADLLAKYKKTRQEEREETKAQIQASFSIMQEKMKSPFRSFGSDILSAFANSKAKNEHDVANNASDAVTSSLNSMFSGISKLLAPEKITKQDTPKKDTGANNPNFKGSEVGTVDREKHARLVSALQTQRNINEADTKVIDYAINQLEKISHNKDSEKKVKDNKKIVEERAKEIEQREYDRMNEDKKEALADWKAKQEIFKEKYKPANIIRSLASDAFASLAKGPANEHDVANSMSDAFTAKLNYGQNLMAKKLQAWMPSKKEEGKKDEGQDNPNFGQSLGEEIKKDLAEIKDSISDSMAEDENDFETLYDKIMGDERKKSKDRDNLNDIENGIFEIDQYIKHQLVNKIVSELQSVIKTSSAQSQASGEGEDGEDDGDEDEDGNESMGNKFKKWKNRFRKGRLGMRKAARYLKHGGRLAMHAGRTALSMGGGALQTLGGGAAASGGSAGMAMAGGAAVLALGAASAYTFYKTGEVAATIIGNKEDVRESTKGSSEASIARNKEKYTKDSDEVKRSVPRYKKAGFSDDEASASALAERQNTKMLTTSATMGGIFSAAKNSTDFRTSEEEMGKLTEGEMLADTIGNVLRMLNGTLADPAQLKNKTPQEIKNLSNQAKIAVKQIGDLKKTWEDAKKLGTDGMDSPWVKDKNMVDNGDSVINSLVDAGGDIEKSFDEWSEIMQRGASMRTDKQNKANEKPTTDQSSTNPQTVDNKTADVKTAQKSRSEKRKELYDKLKSEGKLSDDPDIAAQQMMAEERIQNMKEEAETEKSPTNEGSTRTGIDLDNAIETGHMKPPKGFVDPATSLKDRIESVDKDTKPAISKVGEDIKGAITGHTESLGSKIDQLTAKIESMAAKKPPAPPAQYNHGTDVGFSNINNLAKGA